MRLDRWLYLHKDLKSRQRALYLIKNGLVHVNGKRITKAGYDVKDNDLITLSTNDLKFVGRGGYKLEHAIHNFKLDFYNKIVLDIGACTGGFTDCALYYGAKHVYAVDVGHGQLDKKLLLDERVTNFEGINIKDMTNSSIPTCDFVVSDVSFISITKILEDIKRFLKNTGYAIVLIKPQFEVGRMHNKNGVVKNKQLHIEVLERTIQFASTTFYVDNIDYSPIKGGDGNIEFLLLLKYGVGMNHMNIKMLVEKAHQELKGRNKDECSNHL